MSISLFLIGSLFLAIFILPVIYIHRVQKNKSKLFLKHFASVAAKNQVKITNSDIWNSNNCIGIDTNSNKLFTLIKKDNLEDTNLIDLQDVSQCNVSETYRKTKGNKHDNITERVDLILGFKNGSKETINFFNLNDNSFLSDEHSLAQKWTDIINTQIQ
ncbi:MAG: hypothetical protein AB7S48_13735 [Bacteroidales bacterium]